MLALSFFGIIHVPINVPALGAAAKEDDVDVNRELIAHGISNTLSGCVGSIQNYLVYSNSVLFMQNGGDNRVAGFLLAVATGAVWMAGPAMIGFIPVCLVGALIFLLGIELLEEALWDTFGRCHRLEYVTIIAIVLIMGVYDFVVGIFTGIVLACVSYVVQSSRTPAVRATYSGEVAESTVRRPRGDRRYLNRVRSQIRVIKLSGFLFFGTIVSVEAYMRSLIEEDHFQKNLTSFIIVDFKHVTDVDFSSSEGFLRINRILARKHVKLIVSGISFSSKVGHALQNVGLFDVEKNDDDCPPPRVFEDLNMALEACENELLESFYLHCGSGDIRKVTPPMAIVPDAPSSHGQNSGSTSSASLQVNPLDPGFQSPRRGAQFLAAATTMREQGPVVTSPENGSKSTATVPSKWKNFGQPIKIILQTFDGMSSKGVDFWHIAAPYFERCEYPAGTVLYSRGDEPDGFYILERGRFRAEYEHPQGRFYEVILPGTTCGELPFFSETDRTGTVAAENDSVAWLLTREKYKELEQKNPDVARELLKVGLKLTKERMDAITSYVPCPA
jgi:SulP family sulfate permease